jgi:hypothetical protein
MGENSPGATPPLPMTAVARDLQTPGGHARDVDGPRITIYLWAAIC